MMQKWKSKNDKFLIALKMKELSDFHQNLLMLVIIYFFREYEMS